MTRGKTWSIYLSGEIHTDWRERIEQGAAQAGLDARFRPRGQIWIWQQPRLLQ